MRIATCLLLAGLGLSGVWAAGARAPAGPASGQAAAPAAAPVLATREDFIHHCGQCHADGAAKGGFALDKLAWDQAPRQDPAALDRMLRTLADGRMPPLSAGDQPTEAERQRLCDHLRAVLAASPTAGPVARPARRLTPEELDYTWGDLLGLETRAARDALPQVPPALGFDTVAALPMTPADVEKLLGAAQAFLAQAFGSEPAGERKDGSAFKAEAQLVGPADGAGVMLATNGTLSARFACPAPGTYRLTLKTGQTQAGDENAKFTLRVGDAAPVAGEVTGRPMEHVFKVAAAGEQTVQLAFINDYWNAETKADRNFILQSATLTGPEPDAATRARRERWLAAPRTKEEEEAAAKRQLAAFTAAAWHGNASTEAREGLLKVFQDGRSHGDTHAQALQNAYAAALCSPRCACLLERFDTAGSDDTLRVDDTTLAARLSYFLWAGPPDETLVAATAKLHEPGHRRAEAKRLLADPKAGRFAARFSGQWLQTRALDEFTPSPALFPGWSPAWRQRLQREVTLVFLDTLRSGAPVTALVNRPETFVDEALAAHYGVASADFPLFAGFGKVPAPPHHDAGVLTCAAVLILTSNPDRTNPVRRGKWVMEALLDTPPPPPPPVVPALPALHDAQGKPHSARERLAIHRETVGCRECHARMDPIGLSLEAFDSLGRFRVEADGLPVDVRSAFPGGAPFEGAAGLRDLILAHPDRFERVVLDKLFIYALGRAPAPGERQELEAVRLRARGKQKVAPLESLVLELVASDLFRAHSSVRLNPRLSLGETP